ncbi:MAG TPA: Na+/H+ antiporter NhaA [Polyangiaceae bacterium]|nr:Na+/H+ antiporter NhaA [Polyangiaceae bacterium]
MALGGAGSERSGQESGRRPAEGAIASDPIAGVRLLREVDPASDHVRGSPGAEDAVTVVAYGDFLCPYCRRLLPVIVRLREALGDRLVYVFRHFPNERAHPGAELAARAAEAAARQGRFWEMYDRIYGHEPPVTERLLLQFAGDLHLDMDRFVADLASEDVRERVESDLEEGRTEGVTGTPTLFVAGVRYDGAWDFYSMLEAVERPVAARVKHAGRVFASLPASGGLVLLLAAAAAIACANSRFGPQYRAAMASTIILGSPRWLAMSVAQWCSEGLLAIFFLIVGLEIRREMTAGALTDRRAAALPVIAAIGGVVIPAAIYLALNAGTPAARGWSIPTATDVAFTLGIMALLGAAVPASLRVFVAALAVVDDVLSVLTLAITSPHSFEVWWLVGAAAAVAGLFVLNRWRVYATWAYAAIAIVLWIALHHAGVHGALAGILLAMFVPAQPAPRAGPLLAQAATALAALDHAEREMKERQRGQDGQSLRLQEESVWDWASRNLSAASERLLSPADRIERALAPWSTYVILPLFAFTATGVELALDLSNGVAVRVLAGVVLGLVIGKPLGIVLATWISVKTRIAMAPEGVTTSQFLGAACLCGIADTVALLMADQSALSMPVASVAKIGCFLGSLLAAALGSAVLLAHRARPEGRQ